MRFALTFRWSSPGRCIVCEAPLCTCTGDAGNVEVPIRRPGALDVLARSVPHVVAALPAASFTTATYRRDVHGPGRVGTRSAVPVVPVPVEPPAPPVLEPPGPKPVPTNPKPVPPKPRRR